MFPWSQIPRFTARLFDILAGTDRCRLSARDARFAPYTYPRNTTDHTITAHLALAAPPVRGRAQPRCAKFRFRQVGWAKVLNEMIAEGDESVHCGGCSVNIQRNAEYKVMTFAQQIAAGYANRPNSFPTLFSIGP